MFTPFLLDNDLLSHVRICYFEMHFSEIFVIKTIF